MVRALLLGIAVVSLIPCVMFLAVWLMGHPILLAGREDGLHVWVPYVSSEVDRPVDVFRPGVPVVGQVNLKGFEIYYVATSDGTTKRWNLWFDPWAPTVVCALPMVAWVAVRMRSRRRARRLASVGHCPRCGYDLRATPDRCPECGHVPRAA